MSGALLAQTLLGTYRVEAFIAKTPLGEFYKALDTKQERYLGLLALPAEAANDPEVVKQFDAASFPLQKLRHPNLTPYLGLYRTADVTFLLEEWVDGPSLRDVLRAAPSLSVEETLCYARAIATSLDLLHAQGWVHLALAPELIRINRRGEIRLCGLGGCRRNGENGFVRPGFAAHYAAPEQFNAAAIGPATDQYALGMMLYEALAGAAQASAWKNRFPEEELPKLRELNPSLPELLARILPKGLASKPTERFANGREYFLSLCMAARTPAENVPERVTSLWAPVSQALLTEWQYSPAIAASRIAIEETVVQAAAAPARVRNISIQRWLTLATGLALLLGVFYLLSQLEPTHADVPPTPPPGESIPTSTIPAELAAAALPSTQPPSPNPTNLHGRRIIYTCTRGNYNHLCLINEDGTEPFQLTSDTAHDYYPNFAPTGGMIVFASNRTLGMFDLYVMVFAGMRTYRLTSQIGNVISPDFSPDGEMVVFANRPDEGPTAIWIVDKDGLSPRQLYTGAKDIVGVAWSPDGKTIAFAMAVDQLMEYEIFLMDTEGQNVRRISQGILGIGGSLDWSPDGSNLLIYAGPPGDKNIFKLDVVTGAATQLTFGGNNASAAYSPDGQWIVFNSLRTDEQADLYLMRADGSELKQLTDNAEPDWQAQWEP